MIKSGAAAATSSTSTSENSVRAECSLKSDKKKKSILPKLFNTKKNSKENSEEEVDELDEGDVRDSDNKIIEKKKSFLETSSVIKKSFSERHSSCGIEGLNLSTFDEPMGPATIIQDIRMFVATWNVGGKTPNKGLNLEDFLLMEGSSDIYVLGFQEIVPLSAGNVLVVEDNEPAAKWLTLISQALNKSQHDSIHNNESSTNSKHNSKDSKSNFFQKPNLKVLTRNLMADNALHKVCNCPLESSTGWIANKRRPRKISDPSRTPFTRREIIEDDHLFSSNREMDSSSSSSNKKLKYCLVTSKQMVGIFISVWARRELVHHIGHLRVSSVGRGIMGCLGNKGCISISMSLHQTSFCFVCSHLASGEKDGDELKRNNDVAEILKSVQFPKICKNPNSQIPERIIDHDRIIWLGDLNYRVSLSYEKTRVLLEENDWDSLLKRDQLNLEREAGRVFAGWKEGRIYFAPTYKYSQNSDSYAGETVKSKKKRRTPAWCDRILWHGSGIEQLSYIRGESRFSDHRPVCAVFTVEIEAEMKEKPIVVNRFRKGFSCAGTKLAYDDALPRRRTFYEC